MLRRTLFLFTILFPVVGAVMLGQERKCDDNGPPQQDLGSFKNEKGGEIMSGNWQQQRYPHFVDEENGFVDDDEDSTTTESHQLLDSNRKSSSNSGNNDNNTKCQAAAPVSSVVSKGERMKAKQKVMRTEEMPPPMCY